MVAAKGARVDTMVPGLYDAIDPNVPPKGWSFKDKIQNGELSSEIFDPNGKKGFVLRKVDKQKQTWALEEAFFATDMERWVPMNPALADGKGTPLLAYADMRLMKLAGVNQGSLKTVKMSTIQNMETLCQVASLERQGIPLNEAIAQTHSVAYAKNEIIQSGHAINRVELKGGSRSAIGPLMEHYENPARSASPVYRTPDQHDAILAKYGLTRTDIVLWNFDIEILLGGK